jgi:hypothetical protein
MGREHAGQGYCYYSSHDFRNFQFVLFATPPSSMTAVCSMGREHAGRGQQHLPPRRKDTFIKQTANNVATGLIRAPPGKLIRRKLNTRAANSKAALKIEK